MPYKINWEENGVVIQFSGIFDFEVNKNANCEVWEDPRCDSINYAIWDASGVSEALMTEIDFNTLAMQDHVGSSRLPSLKLALLARDKQTRHLFEYYASNYYSRLNGWNFMVSDSMDKLRSWIAS